MSTERSVYNHHPKAGLAKRLPIDVALPQDGGGEGGCSIGMQVTLKTNLCPPEEG